MKVGIIGASGYTGYELIKILKKHQKVELIALNSQTYAGQTVKSLYPDFEDQELKFTDIPTDELIGQLGVAIGFANYQIIQLRTRGGKWKDNPQRHTVALRESIVTLVKE